MKLKLKLKKDISYKSVNIKEVKIGYHYNGQVYVGGTG